jgi:hypothetical protein
MAVNGAPPPKKGKKKIPTWYYVAGAGAAVALWYLYSKSKASKAAAASTAGGAGVGTSSAAGTAAGSYGNAGDLASLLPYLQSNQATGATSTGSGAAYTPPTGESLQAGTSSYLPPTGKATAPITDASGNNWVWIQSPAQLQALEQSGAVLGIQTLPGIFQPVSNAQLQSGAQYGAIYTQVPSNYGTTGATT